MPEKNPVEETLNIVLEQLHELERQATAKKRTVNDLCRVLGRPVMFEDTEAATGFSTRPDEYYGRPAPEVIRSILEKRKQANLGAATIGEIYAAMNAGSYHFQTANDMYAKRGIYSVLSDESVFHKLPGGRFGLVTWYPAIRAKSSQEEAKPKKPHRKGGSKLKARKPKGRVPRKPGAEKVPPPAKEEAPPVNSATDHKVASKATAHGTGNESAAAFAKGALHAAIVAALPQAPAKFTKNDIVKRLHEKGVKTKEKAVRKVLAKLAAQGDVIEVEPGGGNVPNVYQRRA